MTNTIQEKPKATGYSQKADLRYPATAEKFPTSAYDDKGNGTHGLATEQEAHGGLESELGVR
jgi:hypothetical protein